MKKNALLELKSQNPFPKTRPSFKPFNWKLDGGGRNLITSAIDEYGVRLMVEVGVLFGGSSLQWLVHKSDLLVIGIDPWQSDAAQMSYWWNNREGYGLANLDLGEMSEDEFYSQLLRDDALYSIVISNLWAYRDRFIPVRGWSPQAIEAIAQIGVIPDLIYFDSDKKLNDMEICLKLFPQSIICGDDWSWSPADEPDRYPVQEIVGAFALKHNFQVIHEGATWILKPTGFGAFLRNARHRLLQTVSSVMRRYDMA